MALPCFAMSCFMLPVTLCKEIDSAIARRGVSTDPQVRGITVNFRRGAGRALSKEDDFWKLDCDGELEMEAAYISGNTRGSLPRIPFGLYHDTLICQESKHGRYVVKSGYELTRHLQHNGELGRKGEGETSSTHGRNDLDVHWFEGDDFLSIWRFVVNSVKGTKRAYELSSKTHNAMINHLPPLWPGLRLPCTSDGTNRQLEQVVRVEYTAPLHLW
ncbi:hypothetical protein L3X38_037089 [Prunus dulcis]|uniref:Uncharacterized protein n=1 Tax=Prunus dulcis TaxID=3755 RepID=A0AAD4V4F3_PRUDU|nr:hypothetical protein L3X38_037089 [Prunus dulcis]